MTFCFDGEQILENTFWREIFLFSYVLRINAILLFVFFCLYNVNMEH